MRIFLIGFMGSGKTTVGKELAYRLGYLFMDMDKVIEAESGMPVSRIFDERGEDEFRRMEHELILKTIQMEDVVISTGGGVPCFHDNLELINKHGISIYLKMKPEDLLKRLKGSKYERPLIRDLSTKELDQYIKEKLRDRETHYLQSKYVIDGSHPDVLRILEMIVTEEK
jgi:shikimate kinase